MSFLFWKGYVAGREVLVLRSVIFLQFSSIKLLHSSKLIATEKWTLKWRCISEHGDIPAKSTKCSYIYKSSHGSVVLIKCHLVALWIFQPGIFAEKTLRLEEELYLRPDESGGGRFELKGMGFRRDQVGESLRGWGLGVGWHPGGATRWIGF